MEDKKTKNSAEATAEKTTGAKVSKPKRKTGKAKPAISHGRAYIQATYNNTIVTLADLNGNVLAWSSAGSSGFKGPKKSTPYAASLVVKNALDKAAESGIKEVNVFISGVGQGREGAIRAFQANNIAVLSIKDVTPIPHNGCRAPRPRRV
ncbi:MAG: 30S ribosomal protein S11 [Patescibacteria group bacterium]